MENVLFKISFPAEFHSQTAVEAAMTLQAAMVTAGRSESDIRRVTIRTHEACIRIIDKKGPLNNPAVQKREVLVTLHQAGKVLQR